MNYSFEKHREISDESSNSCYSVVISAVNLSSNTSGLFSWNKHGRF